MKIKSILITQPKPKLDKSPYLVLSKKYNIKIDFIPFFHIEGITAKEFKRGKINILDYSAVIITSRHCIDHYFRLCDEMRIEVPESMKYFCASDAIAYYIQKYVSYKKRKVFHAQHNISDMIKILRRHKGEKFFLPCSNVHNREIDQALDKEKINYKKALFYRAVPNDISYVKKLNYDIVVFFSPADVKSLKKNFPKFRQSNIQIAAFGSATAKAVQHAGLQLNICSPTTESPSMTMALEHYIRNIKNNKK
ncbi:MAG: uroporphyrinogen-III synthase [Bacteroidota bacterium]